jgi:hypothetical protein
LSDGAIGFEARGFAVVPSVLDELTCSRVSDALDAERKSGAGTRLLLQSPWCQELASRLRSLDALIPFLPADAVAIQCTVFDKSPEKNWLVALHQDRSIPVREKVEAPELSGWSEKEGAVFVQPPVALLQQLTAVRVHIDACPLEGGPLRVVPGSHRAGLLSNPAADEWRAAAGEIALVAARGDALVMKPLLLHASSKASSVIRRRVLHFVFGPRNLPLGLRWRHAL